MKSASPAESVCAQGVYDQIESRVSEMMASGALDEKRSLAYKSFLFLIIKTLPLRPTKSFLAFSVERLDKASPAFQASCALWQEGFSGILADVLEYLRYAHATHNPASWTDWPTERRGMVDRVLCDRFWQSGISEGSKDDFYARVLDKKKTMEGLASTIRGSIRFVRETAYAIIYCMSRLDLQFYGFDGLSGPLSDALFSDSTWLSTHQQNNLLNLVRYLVDDCPVDHRTRFLPQLLTACFRQTDAKIHGEWDKMEKQETTVVEDEAGLKEEMKAESILRQVTYTAVMMIADFLDPTKAIPEFRAVQGQDQPAASPHGRSDACTQAETTAVPAEIASVIREYISSDVLKACLTSFHEPYFVEIQKDLAALIATIVAYYSPLSPTPRDVLLSLPNVDASGLERLRPYMAKPEAHTRQQRAIVLDLLKDLKGVSVSEMGRVAKSADFGGSSRSKRGHRSKMAQGFMNASADGEAGLTGGSGLPAARGSTPDALEAVSNLFGG
ncbi:hypothetical protein UVI_02021030 [Ustilaginoidea virens]|uniref:Exportin-5 C-terminal domain-containing protein n=1 Tax=Ustilaginoidea virens TaxID=1159556 RepID=A0A1B5KXW6_USTVR|nr:hypothetical protein UVI_02021030 [Ustilaginoidea virens]